MRIEQLFRKQSKPKYDWVKIWKEYEKLDIPVDRWKPSHIDMNASAHKIIISKRSSGKTTQILLLGLLMNKMYKTTTVYVRQYSDIITPKKSRELIGVIKECGYIQKLTNNKYSDLFLYGGVWRYCNRDENGKVKEQSDIIMYMCGINEAERLKSSFNTPHGDLIIIDEFLASGYMKDEFFQCMDLVSTIGRERPEVYTFFLGNSLNYYNMYLQEFGISRDIRKMSWGDSKTIMSGEVPIYVELINPDLANNTETKQEKKRVTLFRFGFNNSNMASITGVGGWNMKHYQHLPSILKPTKKLHQAIVRLNGDHVRVEVYYDKRVGNYAVVKPAYKYKEDIRVYTLDDITEYNEVKWCGMKKSDKKLWGLILSGRCYYATNECGLIIEEYLNEVKNRSI